MTVFTIVGVHSNFVPGSTKLGPELVTAMTPDGRKHQWHASPGTHRCGEQFEVSKESVA